MKLFLRNYNLRKRENKKLAKRENLHLIKLRFRINTFNHSKDTNNPNKIIVLILLSSNKIRSKNHGRRNRSQVNQPQANQTKYLYNLRSRKHRWMFHTHMNHLRNLRDFNYISLKNNLIRTLKLNKITTIQRIKLVRINMMKNR